MSSRLQSGSVAAVLLIGIILQGGCSRAAQRDMEPPLSVPAQPQATATLLPTPVRSTINITIQEYESALATWRAQGVLEYEITLIDSSQMVIGGKMRLRIRLDSGEAHLVEYVRLGQDQPQIIPLDTVNADELEYLQGLGVDAMSRLIGDLFDEQLTNPSGPIFDYDVAFDPTLGYATHVYSRVFSREEGLSPTECCISYEVLTLGILRSSAPGMPKAGNPCP